MFEEWLACKYITQLPLKFFNSSEQVAKIESNHLQARETYFINYPKTPMPVIELTEKSKTMKHYKNFKLQ